GSTPSQSLYTVQHGEVSRRYITIPEGMPSCMVHERLMAEALRAGALRVPERGWVFPESDDRARGESRAGVRGCVGTAAAAVLGEGSVLAESYDFERGESRAAVHARMQKAMADTLAELCPKRSPDTVEKTPEEAVILASIVEKEPGVASERRMVAGLYSNRVRVGMLLQADPTIIYPITKGKPLGRRIRQSEIAAVNDYNTYTMVGLPKGPITNPGRASIEAVLNP